MTSTSRAHAGSARQPAAAGGQLSLLSFQRFDSNQLDSSARLVGDRPQHLQIGRGPVEGQADQISLDKSTIRIGSFSQAVRVQVRFPDDRATLGVALDVVQPIWILGRTFASSELTVFGPAEEIDVVFSPRTKWVTFNLPLAEFDRELAVTAEHPAQGRLQGVPRFRPGASSATRLRGLVAGLEELAHDRPELFGDAQWRINTERQLRSGFFGLLDDATLLDRGDRGVHLPSARSIVQEAEARLDEEEATIPAIGELCRKLGVSRRTLERAFHEAVGLGPAAYFRIRALNAVRRELLHAEPQPGMVTRLALDQGFWHLGRFARAYHALFGERPVDTLHGRSW